MGGVFAVLAVLAYLFLLIDWSDLRNTLRLGGWASICLYVVLIIAISSVLSNPPAIVAAGAVHH